jgi:hypothetical protein
MQSSQLPLDERVPAEIRAEMAFQQKTVVELAGVLGVSRQSARRRYDGDMPFALNEVEAIAEWLNIERSQIVMGLHSTAKAVA